MRKPLVAMIGSLVVFAFAAAWLFGGPDVEPLDLQVCSVSRLYGEQALLVAIIALIFSVITVPWALAQKVPWWGLILIGISTLAALGCVLVYAEVVGTLTFCF